MARTGDESDAAIVLTTLILFAIFTPVKNYLQGIVDRNFKEPEDISSPLREFDQQVQSVLRIIDPRKLSYGPLDRAAKSLSARSGALLMEGGGGFEVAHRYGPWDGDEALSVPIQMGDRVLGRIMLGPSLNHSGHIEEDRRVLEACASRAAHALSIVGESEA